ncbi:hypothetical protein, partial [Kribbia dieselivorans]|uniref:hypothetical protein n=1 Tax=Kribbia dieselivorans TaxID=331526 RepID=UPI00159C5FB5
MTRGVVVLGLVLMLTSSWRLWWLQTRLSEGNACTLHGLCDAVANAHAQERLGWYFLLGIAVVLTGLVMTFVRRRYEDAVAPVAGPSGLPEWAHHERETMPPWEHAAFSLAVLLPLVFATPVALLFVFLGPHSFLAMLAVYWIVAAFLLDRLHRAVSTDSRQRALLTSLLAPGLSIVPLVGSLPLGLASISTGAVAVLGSALIQGGVVLVGRTWPWPWRRPEVWLAAGVALVVGGLGIQQTLLHQGDGSLTRVAVALSEAVDPRVAVSGPTPHDAPTPTPSPNPTTPTPSTPTATAPTPTAPTS